MFETEKTSKTFGLIWKNALSIYHSTLTATTFSVCRKTQIAPLSIHLRKKLAVRQPEFTSLAFFYILETLRVLINCELKDILCLLLSLMQQRNVSMPIITLPILSSQKSVPFGVASSYVYLPLLFDMLIGIMPLASEVLLIQSECECKFCPPSHRIYTHYRLLFSVY